jgi:hypothetical protein
MPGEGLVTVKAVLILVAVLACFAAGYYLRDLQDTTHTQAAVIKQTAANQKTEARDDGTIAIEEKAYDDAILQPVAAPVVRLCVASAAAVSQTTAPAGRPHATAAGGAEHQPDFVQGPDIGRPLVTAGRDADALIAGLQDYVAKVCRAP